MERGRIARENKIFELALTYLKDGLTPEEAEKKARDCFVRLSEIHRDAQRIAGTTTMRLC